MSRVAKNVEGSKKCRGEQNLMFFDKCNFKICRPTQKGGGGGRKKDPKCYCNTQCYCTRLVLKLNYMYLPLVCVS